ncbi:YtxH domain-containing protein [Labedella phragmitis]|uniref:YtxH domain-containing protein n=1 Tax=Labedella phragmitis TaxID=2498849 RepID=A0A444PT82_9MICO|nr:YtxH domain-containing protein [Labedella phragmitis]RWZ51049.1 YtxH domain-containing protein [Labedella phragmitis]
MKAKLIFLAGAATGFVLGSKAGRGAYEKIKAKATETWEDPKVQKGLETAGEFVSSQAPVVGHKLQDAASTVASKVKKNKGSDDSSGDDSSSDSSSTGGTSSVGGGSSSDSGDVTPGSAATDR